MQSIFYIYTWFYYCLMFKIKKSRESTEMFLKIITYVKQCSVLSICLSKNSLVLSWMIAPSVKQSKLKSIKLASVNYPKRHTFWDNHCKNNFYQESKSIFQREISPSIFIVHIGPTMAKNSSSVHALHFGSHFFLNNRT